MVKNKALKVSFFIPVYNEEKTIKKNLNKVIEFLELFNIIYEIIIVDDNSSDNSRKIVKELLKKHFQLKLLKYSNGPSRRENLADAFKKAKYDLVIYMDNDLSTDLTAIPNLLIMLNKYPIVIGSRYLKKSKIDRKFYRRIISLVYNSTLRIIFSSKIRDHTCGFKGFQKKILLDLVTKMRYDKSFTRGWFWDAELLIRAQKKGHQIKEIPVMWTRGEKSSFSFLREIKLIKYMIDLNKRI